MAELLLSLDPTSIAPSEYKAQFKQFIQQFEFNQLLHLINTATDDDDDGACSSSHDGSKFKGGDTSKHHHSFYVQVQDLIHFNSSFAYTILYHPKLLSPVLELSLKELQQEVLSHPSFKTKAGKVDYSTSILFSLVALLLLLLVGD